jgi:hypothetical protein
MNFDHPGLDYRSNMLRSPDGSSVIAISAVKHDRNALLLLS